jgi:glutathione S-transferase
MSLQMMLIHKEIPFESILISPLLIPPGIAAPPLNGRLPSLVHKDFRSSDPIEAARYLEAAFPDISLSQPSASDCDAIYAKVHSLYPAFYKYIVNKDAGLDDALRISAFTELDRVDQLLQRTPGRYIGGVDMTWVDLLLAPTLFHIAVGSEHIKGSKVYNYQYTPTRPAVENYLTRMMASSLFKDKRAYVHIEKIVHSWKMARGDAKLPYVPNLNMKLLGPSEPIQLTPSSPSTRVLSSEHNISAKIDGTLAVSVAQSGDSDGGHAVKNPRGRTAASSKVSAAPAGASLPASDAIISTSSSGGVDLDPAVITEPLSQSLSTSTPSPPPTRRRNRAVPDASSSLPETSESKSSRHSKGVSKTSTRSKASVSATTRRSSKGGVEGKKAKATRVSTKTPRVKE